MFRTGLLIAVALALVVYGMARLVLWARKRSRGAVITGALMSVFAPDPTLETQIRLVDESSRQQVEADEEGEPK